MKPSVYLEPLHAALKIGTERAMQDFIEHHLRPLVVAYSHGSNGFLIVPHFRFGRNYRANVLVLSAHSGAWHAALVELDSPSADPYLADGTASCTKRVAMSQRRNHNGIDYL